MWGQLYRKVLVSAVFALVFLGFFVNLGLAEVIEKGAGVDTIPVQAPAYSAVLRDWYSEGDYVYHYSNPDGSGIFYHKEVRRELAGSNYYGSGYNIFYYVLVYPNGTEQILYEKRINTADATQSETVDMGGDYVPRTRTHSYSKIDIAAMNLTADIPDFGHYKVELRRVEIPKIMLNKNPMENYNLEDKLDKWNAEIINTLYSSSSWSDGAWWREYKDEACSTEGPVGNITLRTAVTVNSHGPNGYPTTSCSEYNMNPASGSVCKYNYYMYTEDDGPRYVNHVMTNKCWIERSGFEKVKVKDLQKGVIWTHEFDVKQPLTITGATACGDIECRTNPTFRPQEEAFFFVNVSEPAGLQLNVWKSVTVEETRDKYSDLKFGAEVKGDTEFMKITTDGVGYRRIITTDKFSYPLKIKWRGKYAFYQAGMVNLFYGDQEDFSMGNHNGDITGFYLGTFDSGAMNANYDGGVNLGQPEINKEHTYELQVLKDKLIWFLDGNKVNEKVLSSPRPASRVGIIAYGGSVEFQLKEFQIDLGDGQINGNINGGDKFLNFTANNQEALSKYSDYKFSIISEPEWGKPYVLQNGKLKLSGGTYFPTQPSPESRYDRHSCNGDPNGCGWYGSSATFRTQDKFEYPVKIKWKGTIEAGYSGLNYNNIDLSYHNKDDTGQMSRFIGFFWDGWYRRMHAVSNIIPAGQQYPPGLSFGDLSGTEHEYELDIYKDKIVWLLDGNKVMEQALSQPLDAGSVEVRAHGELRVAFSLSSLEVDKGDLVLKSDFSSPGLLRPVFEDKQYLVGMRPIGTLNINNYLSDLVYEQNANIEYTELASWKFEGDATDSVGGNYNGTVSGTTKFVQGYAGSGLYFDGGAGGVEVPNILNGLSGFKIEAWFKVDDFGTWRWIYGSGPDWTDVGIAATAGGNTLRYHLTTENDQFYNGEGQNIVSNGEWHKIEYIYDGREAKGYVDGKFDFSRKIIGKVKTTRQQAIGKGFWNNNEYFKGSIDEVKIYRLDGINVPQFSIPSASGIFEFSPQEEGNYELEFVARADEREDSYSVPVPVYYSNGITESFVSNPFVQDSGVGGGGSATADTGSTGSMLPLAAVSVAGAAGIYFVANRSQTKKVITGIKSGLTEYGNALVKRSKEILDFIQEEKNGYWVKIWEARMRAEAAMWARFNAAQAEKQKAQWFEENKQTIWAAAQANEALEMLKSGKGDPGWFVQRMQYLSESAGDRELAAQLAGMGTQVQAQLEARPAVIYTPDLTKPAAAPAKIEQKSLLDNVMGFFGNALGNAKKLVGGALDIVGKIPVVGKPIVQAVGAARDFVVEKSDFIKSLSDNAGWAGLGMMVGGGILMGAGALASATGIGAVAGVPLAAVGAGLLQGGFALGAASAVTDAGVWAAKESTGKASEDDRFNAMFAPLMLVGGGLGKGVKGWKALNNVKKPVAKIVESGVRKTGYSLERMKSEIGKSFKEQIKKFSEFKNARAIFRGYDANQKYAETSVKTLISVFYLRNMKPVVDKLGKEFIDETVNHEILHMLSKLSPQKFWKGPFDFSKNVINWLQNSGPIELGQTLDEIVIIIKSSMKYPKMIAQYHDDLANIGNKPFEILNYLRKQLGEHAFQLRMRGNIIEAHEFEAAVRKLGKLAEQYKRKGEMLPAIFALPSLDSLVDKVKDSAMNMLSDIPFVGDNIIVPTLTEQPLSVLPPERFELVTRAVLRQEENYGIKPRVTLANLPENTYGRAAFDVIQIDRDTALNGNFADDMNGLVAHEYGHIYIAQERYGNRLNYNIHGIVKTVSPLLGFGRDNSWFDELEADALVRAKTGKEAFMDWAGVAVTRHTRFGTVEGIVSAELIADRSGNKALIKTARDNVKIIIDSGKVSEADYNEIKDLLDNWLKNTIDKGKVGSEHGAGEVLGNISIRLSR